jgi:hypothetical protein
VVFHPLGVIIDFWEIIAYYQPSWYIGVSCKASLLVKFIGVQARKSNKSTMLARFSSLPHGFELLEGNIHDQDVPPSRVLQWVPIPMGTQYPPIPMGKWVGNGYGLGRMGG